MNSINILFHQDIFDNKINLQIYHSAKNNNFGDVIGKKEDLIRTHIFDSNIENSIKNIEKHVIVKHSRFVAVKLLEQDYRFIELENNEIQ